MNNQTNLLKTCPYCGKEHVPYRKDYLKCLWDGRTYRCSFCKKEFQVGETKNELFNEIKKFCIEEIQKEHGESFKLKKIQYVPKNKQIWIDYIINNTENGCTMISAELFKQWYKEKKNEK